jgi:hypothetical protein
MRELLRLFTPPEWSEWHWLARIVYFVVFIGIMVPVWLFARWLSEALFPGS